MTCSKSPANALVLSKQDNTNGTCAADLEQIIIWLDKLINGHVQKYGNNFGEKVRIWRCY